jgi:hypothetical protein
MKNKRKIKYINYTKYLIANLNEPGAEGLYGYKQPYV